MSAMTASTGTPFRGKALATARLHLVNLRGGLVVPLIILGVILVANIALWAIILTNLSGSDRADAQQGMQYSGAAFYFITYMVVFGVQAMSVTFPFALGWGVTRRDYYLGTLLAILVRSIAFGALFAVLSLIETATHGWFYGGSMFTAVYFPLGDWWVRLLGFVAMFALAMILGAAIATVWVRWRGTGMLVLWVGLGIVAVAAVAILTYGSLWPSVGSALTALFSLPSAALWALLLVPSVVLAGLGWLVLRRAAPRG